MSSFVDTRQYRYTVDANIKGFTTGKLNRTSFEYEEVIQNLKNIWGTFLDPSEGNELLDVTFSSGSGSNVIMEVGSAIGYTPTYIQEDIPLMILENTGHQLEVVQVAVEEPLQGKLD